MRDHDELFAALGRSRFRRRFTLDRTEQEYLRQQGIHRVLGHGRQFIAERLAPARPPRDGKQTPWHNHPVFVAQHATGTCCRRCLERWHGLARERALSDDEQAYVLGVIERWLRDQPAPAVIQRDLLDD